MPVALACSSELEHNLYRNCRLALSIMLQPSWVLRKARFLSHWSRLRAWCAAHWKQAHLRANVTADRRQALPAEAGGTEPGTPWRKPRETVSLTDLLSQLPS